MPIYQQAFTKLSRWFNWQKYWKKRSVHHQASVPSAAIPTAGVDSRQLINEFKSLYQQKAWSAVEKLLFSPEFSSSYRQQEIVDMLLPEAIKDGQEALVKTLLTSPELKMHAHINGEPHSLYAPLAVACAHGQLGIVQYLLTSPELKEKANIHSGAGYGLIWACGNGHLDIVSYLLASPEIIQAGGQHADIESQDGGPLIYAAHSGKLEVVQYLLSSPEITQAGGRHADIKARDYEAFLNACGSGHLEVAKYMLSSPDLAHYPPIDAQSHQALLSACHGGHLEVVKYLINHPQYASIKPFTVARALQEALSSEWLHIVNYLIMDYRMKLTAEVEPIVQHHPEIIPMFEKSNLQSKLQKELEPQDNTSPVRKGKNKV